MTGITVNRVDTDRINDEAPPAGTAIVRPLGHVRAVRERHARQFADASQAAVSRSARAWSWALGESATAPVTDQPDCGSAQPLATSKPRSRRQTRGV